MDGIRNSINAVLADETVAPAPAQPKPAPVTHQRPGGYAECVVEAGDTLWGIARQFGVDFSKLLAVNPQLGNGNALEIGQVLNLPSPAVEAVTQCIVESGDSLGSIASQFGVTVERLIAVNPGLRANPNLIHPGQVLNL
jgi:LysM repeat protein